MYCGILTSLCLFLFWIIMKVKISIAFSEDPVVLMYVVLKTTLCLLTCNLWFSVVKQATLINSLSMLVWQCQRSSIIVFWPLDWQQNFSADQYFVIVFILVSTENTCCDTVYESATHICIQENEVHIMVNSKCY